MKVFKYKGFDQSQPWPTPSWVIAHGDGKFEVAQCSQCKRKSRFLHDFSVQGYNEYLAGDLEQRCFWPNDQRLISLEKHTQELAAALSGVRSIPVIYADWDQTIKPESWLRKQKPKLGVLEVEAAIVGGYNTEKKEFLPTCQQCGQISMDHSFDVMLGLVRPIRSSWGGTDFFRISGATEIFLTEQGRSRLQELGFTNTLLEEVVWHEG